MLFLLPPLLGLTTTGCSSLKGHQTRLMTSFPDPDFLGKHYHQLAIYYNSPSLYERQYVETALVDILQEEGVTAFQSSRIISPTRSWDSLSISKAFTDAGIDGYVHITEVERFIDSVWVPAEEVSETTIQGEGEKVSNKEGEPDLRNDSLYRYTETETTIRSTRGGYWRTYLQRVYRVELIDLPSHRIAWLGETDVRGAIDKGGTALSKRIAGQLGQDGMIASRK